MNWTRYDRLDKYGKIGWLIGVIRRSKRLSEVALAEKVGVDLKVYRKMEKGQTHWLTLQQAYTIAQTLDVSLDEIDLV